METHSIRVTLQKISTEYLNVEVPINNDVLQPANADGTVKVDGKKVLQMAIEIGEKAEEGWRVENSSIQVHPTQGLYQD